MIMGYLKLYSLTGLKGKPFLVGYSIYCPEVKKTALLSTQIATDKGTKGVNSQWYTGIAQYQGGINQTMSNKICLAGRIPPH